MVVERPTWLAGTIWMWTRRSGRGMCAEKRRPQSTDFRFFAVFLSHVRHDLEILLGHNFLNRSINDFLICPIFQTLRCGRSYSCVFLFWWYLFRPKAFKFMPKQNILTNAEQIDPETKRKPTQHLQATRHIFHSNLIDGEDKMTHLLSALCS